MFSRCSFTFRTISIGKFRTFCRKTKNKKKDPGVLGQRGKLTGWANFFVRGDPPDAPCYSKAKPKGCRRAGACLLQGVDGSEPVDTRLSMKRGLSTEGVDGPRPVDNSLFVCLSLSLSLSLSAFIQNEFY